MKKAASVFPRLPFFISSFVFYLGVRVTETLATAAS